MATAEGDPRPENYHDWRKRVKDHWHQVRVLESLWREVLQAREASLKNLETWLGDDHNLVILCDRLTNEPEKYGEAYDVQPLLALAGEHQKELRGNSMSLGERVYEEKPRRFTRNMSKLWDAWQQQPDSMKEIGEEPRKTPQKQPGNAGSAKSTTTGS